MCISIISSGLVQPGRPGDKIVMKHRGQKIISCRKKVETPNRSLINILNARRENGIGRSRKEETETEENLLLENQEFSCQSPQWAAWDDSQGLTDTFWSLDWYKIRRAALETPEKGERQEVCPYTAGLEKAMAGR